MDGLLLVSLGLLFFVFSIIVGFLMKFWWDEHSSQNKTRITSSSNRPKKEDESDLKGIN